MTSAKSSFSAICSKVSCAEIRGMRRVAQYRTSIESPPSRLSCRRRCSRNCVRLRSLSLPHGQRANSLPLARVHAWHARMARMHARSLARTLARANLTHARAHTHAMHARSYKKRTCPRTLHYEARTCGVAPCVARVCAQLAAHVHARACASRANSVAARMLPHAIQP